MKKSPKIEGTSKTYGQFFIPQNSINVINGVKSSTSKKTSGISSFVKIIKTTANTSEQTVKNDSVVGKLADDSIKTQIILAAANSKSDSTVIIQDTKKDVSTQNLGNPQKVEEIVSVLQSETLTKDEVLSILNNSQKIDLFISTRSRSSEPIEYNTLQIPQFQSPRFIYQNWDVNESDISSQEDPSQDPLFSQKLRQVSRYIEFVWDILDTIEQTTENTILKTTSLLKIKETIFRNPRGVGRFSGEGTSKPISNSLKSINLIKEDTTKGKIVDIHDIEKGFDSVSNKQEFVNSVFVKIQPPKSTESSLIFNLMDIIKK